MHKRFLLLFLLSMLLSVFTKAQETTSEIQGSVTDANGSGLAGATIVATNLPSGTKSTTTTRKDGRFNLPNLRVGGPYQVSVSFVGYKPEIQENITLLLGQDFTSNFKLIQETKQLAEVVITNSGQG